MADTLFASGTVVASAWLNDLNNYYYKGVVSSIAALKASLKTGTPRILVTGYYVAGDGGGGMYYYDSTDTTTADNGGSVIVASDNGRWKLVNTQSMSAEQFGAKGDNSTNDSTAFTNLVAAMATGGEMTLTNGKTYALNSVWTWPLSVARLKLRGRGATIRANHTGNCIDLSATNENFSRHVVEDVVLQGPNVSFPNSAAELAGTSTGAGLNIGSSLDTSNTAAGFGIELRAVSIYGFKYGRYMRAVLETNMWGGEIKFCQYGDYWDGGQANSNASWGVRIRENRRIGVASTGATGGSLTNATKNRYYGCIFETNIPYRGDNPAGFTAGYPNTLDTSGTLGVGVYLYNSYDWEFRGGYYENHNYSVVIDGSSDDMSFDHDRYDGGGGGRIGGVKIIGASCANNTWSRCKMLGGNATDANFVMTDSNSTAQVLDCLGFNMLAANLAGAQVYVRNLRLNQASGGQAMSSSGMPPQGSIPDLGTGTTPGNINSLGSATATLFVQGIEEVVFSSQAAAVGTGTTITTIDPGIAGRFMLTIRNIQATRTITIKNNSVIHTKTGADVVLAASVGVITLWIASTQIAYEI